MVVALEEEVAVAEGGGEPLGGGNHLVDTDALVVVGVEEGERFFVEFEALNRAAEDGPKLLVELVEVSDVVAGADGDTRHAADGGKRPRIGVVFAGEDTLFCHNMMFFIICEK